MDLHLSSVRSVVVTFGLTASVVLASCSFSASTDGDAKVDQEQVEAQTGEALADAQDVGITPDIDCPGDLDSEVGATMTCELSVDGEPGAYEVAIKVTSVDGTDVKWSSNVGTTLIDE